MKRLWPFSSHLRAGRGGGESLTPGEEMASKRHSPRDCTTASSLKTEWNPLPAEYLPMEWIFSLPFYVYLSKGKGVGKNRPLAREDYVQLLCVWHNETEWISWGLMAKLALFCWYHAPEGYRWGRGWGGCLECQELKRVLKSGHLGEHLMPQQEASVKCLPCTRCHQPMEALEQHQLRKSS